MRPGEELVAEPFQRLIREQQLVAYDYDGFWLPMDTAKDKKRLDDHVESGDPPWFVWRKPPAAVAATTLAAQSKVLPAGEQIA
jgi:glucose-1-phosphate cytidylyltransferase